MAPSLRNKLVLAAGGGVLAIAAVLQGWYEGDGPTVKKDGVLYHKVYIDPVGVPTVCRGITGKQVVKNKLYTRHECAAMELQHLRIAEDAAQKTIRGFDTLPIWTRAALIDWFYNLGENQATRGSTLVRKFNSGDIEGGCDELKKWVKGRVKGQLVTLNGLVDRRAAENEICLWGDSPK